MKNPEYYRNKAKYPLGVNKEGEVIFGFYAARTHDIIESEHCYIENKKFENIAKKVLEVLEKYNIPIYNEKTKKGNVKSLVLKTGVKTGEVMLILVTKAKGSKSVSINIATQEIATQFPEIKTIVQNIAPQNENTILGTQNKILHGNGYITDILGGYKFKISPLSFYQVNPIQTEILYKKAIEFAELSGKEIVFDLYSGIGTIGIFVSRFAKKVYGIEIVKEAVIDAKENARINDVENIEFITGKVEEELPKLIEQGKNADVVFVDPPRKGLDKTATDCLLSVKPNKIIYISCNPATLARDLNILSESYNISKIQPVDMFPRTSNMETVSLLYRRIKI